MKTLHFHKYQGTGNDFVVLDDRDASFDIDNQPLIEHLCDRRFGIGGDGLMLLRNHAEADFEMIYFNSDGRQSSMCGNGGRCLVQFAHSLGIFKQSCTFMAIDGWHEAFLEDGLVHLKMKDVNSVSEKNGDFVLDTGSPHFVRLVDSAKTISIIEEAHKIRYSDAFKKEGINVNFVEKQATNRLKVRTYERGVENETLSCGTGVTAVALSAALLNYQSPITIDVEGGVLQVAFNKQEEGFSNIYLIGPAVHVFSGEISVPS